MSTQTATQLGNDLELGLDEPLTAYWLAIIRVVTGWWFFHAGATKLIESGLSYTYGTTFLRSMEGTVLGPVPALMANHLAWLIEPGVPLFETLIGLGLIFGALTRLAAVGGIVFMTLFWVGNAAFGHGLVTSELLGLMLFATVIVVGAGRHYGVDGYLESRGLVDEHSRLRYLMG